MRSVGKFYVTKGFAIVVLAVGLLGCEIVDEAARQVLIEPAGPVETGSGSTGRGAAVVISDASGRAGAVVSLAVSLRTGGAKVAGVQNDIEYDSSVLSIASGGGGKPDCQVNPAINKSASAFAFIPSGCRGTGCAGVRAIILSLTDIRPIADGSKLYSCRVTIGAGAGAGAHPLGIAKVALSTPTGQEVPASGVPGTITVR